MKVNQSVPFGSSEREATGETRRRHEDRSGFGSRKELGPGSCPDLPSPRREPATAWARCRPPHRRRLSALLDSHPDPQDRRVPSRETTCLTRDRRCGRRGSGRRAGVEPLRDPARRFAGGQAAAPRDAHPRPGVPGRRSALRRGDRRLDSAAPKVQAVHARLDQLARVPQHRVERPGPLLYVPGRRCPLDPPAQARD